ncbi:unnamed protein product [Lactuca saligna]|uniref:Annexin n=1 Tax=Lactuca saligna TaxID=75948 RepID=A0AA36A0R7_LACSI|nr:unnamed protein product [Lactuca saligna]
MSTIIVPAHATSITDDVEQLHKAFSGWGTDEKLIISILAHRDAEQRKQIRETYAATHNEDLLKSLDKELSNDFEKLVLLWVLSPPERDAYLVNEATKRWTKSNQVVVEVVCTRSSHDLLLAKQAYHARYKKSMEEDIAYLTKGDFRKLLLPLVATCRYEGSEVNMTLAKTEAKLLHEKLDDKCYNDDDLIRILTTRSKFQINATLNQYKNIYGEDIIKELEEDSKDEYISLLRATLECLTYPEKYFERVLRQAINKTGTDETALTRVVATRAEVDMKVIKEEYLKRNSVPLDKAIAKDTRGDYEDMLLALIGCDEE